MRSFFTLLRSALFALLPIEAGLAVFLSSFVFTFLLGFRLFLATVEIFSFGELQNALFPTAASLSTTDGKGWSALPLSLGRLFFLTTFCVFNSARCRLPGLEPVNNCQSCQMQHYSYVAV